MTLNLNPKLKTILKEDLVKGLSEIRVDNDKFLSYESTILLFLGDTKLPKHGNPRDKLQKYIGDSPLFLFVYETLGRELNEQNSYNSESNGKLLKEFQKYNNLDSLAERFINDFETLPWQFTFSFELPLGIGKIIRDAQISYEINPSLKIQIPDDEFTSLYPLKSGIGNRVENLFGLGSLLGGPIEKNWNKGTAIFQIISDGFVGRYNYTNTIEEAIETLKSFLGLSLAIRILKLGKNTLPSSLLIGSPKSNLIVHRKINNDWQIWSNFDLPQDFSETTHNLKINDLNGEVKPDNLKGWILHGFSKISTALNNPKNSKRILRAAQWYFDSYVGSNELLSFVQTMVAMEILLGEDKIPKDMGIGNLLRNRCAYLIGKSYSERDQILKDFNSIYDVRSSIVHRGKSRLTSNERRLFTKLQWMCRRVISEELDLIEKDNKKPDP